jgi:hypothetical protein
MGLWDGYPGENAWETAQSVQPAFAPVEPPEPPKSPPWVPAPPVQKIPDSTAEPYAAPSRPTGPRFGGPVDTAISEAAKRHGVDETWLRSFAKIESGGNPRNTTGSYKGLFQLSNSEFAKHGGQGDIYDPVANANAAAIKLRAQSEAFRNKYGRDPSAADIYMIHQQGEGGYDMHTRNPDRPAWENMARTAEGRQKGAGWARQAIWGNVPNDVKAKYGSVDNMTSRDFLDLWRNKVARFSGDSGMTPAPASNPGPVASASPSRSKPMTDNSGGGFFSFLSKPMDLFGNAENADILKRAGPQGYQPVDGDAFLKKHGLANTPGAKEMLAISNMQRELMAGALQQPQATWGQGIGEALKGVGAVLSSRVDPKMGMQMAGTVGQSHREQQELVRKMQMQALLQQASGLGGNLADVVKDRMTLQNKKEELAAQNAYIDGEQGPGTAVPNVSLTGVQPRSGGVAPSGMPTGAVAQGITPPGSSATAAPVVPGTALGTPPPGLMPTPPAGVVPAAPGAIPPTPGSVPTPNAAPTGGQQPAAADVPDDKAVENEIARLRRVSDRAIRLGNKDRAAQAMEQVKSLQEDLKMRRTNDISEYERYVAQTRAAGKEPIPMFDWQKELKAAGRNMVTIDQRMETEEAKKLGAGAGERANAMITRGQAASTTVQKLNTLEAIQDRVQTGRLAGLKLSAGQWANELKVPPKVLESFGIGKDFVGDAQTLQSQTSRMLVDMLGSGGFPSNNFSNADREFIEKTLPNLGNDPRANRLMMAFMKRAAERDREQYKAWTKAKEQPGMSFDKFALQWAEKVESEDALGDLRAEADKILNTTSSAVTGAPTSAPLPKPMSAEDHAQLKPGDRYLDPTGTVRIKR